MGSARDQAPRDRTIEMPDAKRAAVLINLKTAALGIPRPTSQHVRDPESLGG